MSLDAQTRLAQLQLQLDHVRARIHAACEQAGRPTDSVRLIAVTKTVSTDVIEDLFQCGQREFGENRPQLLIERAQWLTALHGTNASSAISPSAEIKWHLIGQLQSNKIRSVLPVAGMIHSVDSLSLLQRIDRIAVELNLVPRVLLQVSVSGETSKSGFSPKQLEQEWQQISSVGSVEICGLMTMAPLTNDQDVLRQTFRGLRQLRDALQEQSANLSLTELSMGMSNDFELAIEEGATLVRLGSVLFSPLGDR